MSQGKQHGTEYKTKVALMAQKGEEATAELFVVYPTMIHPWNRPPIGGASGVFDRDGSKNRET